MITRRAAVVVLGSTSFRTSHAQTFSGPPPKRGTDSKGNTYTDYFRGWALDGVIIERIYDKLPKRPDGTSPPGGVGVGVRPRVLKPPVTSAEDQQKFDAAKQKMKEENPDVVVDERATASSYSFGAAGTGAVVSAFAYGVAGSIAGLPDQAARIAALQAEVAQLEGALASQLQAQSKVEETVALELAARGARIDALLGAGSPANVIAKASDALAVNAAQDLFATSDLVFAQQLHEVSRAFASEEAAKKAPACLDFGRALVRQADVEHAIGNTATANELYGTARMLADALVGLDPVTGVIRSTYELVTGINLITGEILTPAEQGFAAVNLILLGEFTTVSKGLQVLGRAASVMGGPRGKSVMQTVFNVATKWPTKVIDRVLTWRGANMAVAAEERIAFAATREIVPVGAVDGLYARVMPRQYAEQLMSGGRLAGTELAFITEANQLAGLSSGEEIARRLGMLEFSAGALKPAALIDHVVVEFKFASNEPLAYLARPFGEAGTFGPAFLPGGRTTGGAVEWVIDSGAIEKGLIDLNTLKTRPIRWP